jgi:hypothetical protein
VQFANRVAQNPVGRALEGALVVTAKMPAPGITSLASDLLKPGKDTFGKQARNLHKDRNFPRDIHRFVSENKNHSNNKESPKSINPDQGATDAINF